MTTRDERGGAASDTSTPRDPRGLVDATANVSESLQPMTAHGLEGPIRCCSCGHG